MSYKVLIVLLLGFGINAFSSPHEHETRIDSTLSAIYKSGIPLDSMIFLLDDYTAHNPKDKLPIAYSRSISLTAWIYMLQARYEKCLELGHEALKIQKEIKDSLGLGKTLNRIGLANMQFGRLEESKEYFLEALSVFESKNDTTNIEMMLNNLGVYWSEKGVSENAIDYYKKSLVIRKQLKKTYWVAYSQFNIAEAYLRLNKIDSGSYYYERSIENFKNAKKGIIPSMVYSGLAELNLLKGENEKAKLHALLAYKSAKKRNYDESVLISLKTLILVHSELSNFEKAFAFQEEYIDFKGRLDSANNLAKISEIEAKYRVTERLNEISELKNQQLEDRNQIQNLKIAVLSSFVLIVIVVLILGLFYLRKKQKRALIDKEKDKYFAELKLLTLQQQMNPHFVFNCINTAQSFVINSQKAEAYEYLTNFAKLLRLVLMNSKELNIALEDEIKQIKLYVELESIRFEGQFDYEINVDESLENGVYEVPGLMIQSLVENAILHGLNNLKNKKGKLEIHFSKSTNFLKCTIKDNGIGRLAAQKIKKEKSIYFPSVALPNIQERIQLLQDYENSEIKLEILDLMENNESMGTQVTLLLPLL